MRNNRRSPAMSVAGIAALAALALAAPPATAAPLGTLSEFSNGLGAHSDPAFIAPGVDGNVWFTDQASTIGGSTNAIGQITRSGQITEFSTGLNPGSLPHGIAPGADGNVWFADQGSTRAIGRIPQQGDHRVLHRAQPGQPAVRHRARRRRQRVVHRSALNRGDRTDQPERPDHRVLHRAQHRQQAVRDRAGGGRQRVVHRSGLHEGDRADHPERPDHRVLHRAEPGQQPVWHRSRCRRRRVVRRHRHHEKAIGRITPSGQIGEFGGGPFPNLPISVAPGADGNLWFTDRVSPNGAIGRIGAGAPAASATLPAVAGAGQEGTQQVCDGDRWADWAFQQPSTSTFSWDGYQWLRDGAPLAGKTSRTYAPTVDDVGHDLSCRVTVTYPLPLLVTTAATSEAVAVIPQSSGPTGATGPQGPPRRHGADRRHWADERNRIDGINRRDRAAGASRTRRAPHLQGHKQQEAEGDLHGQVRKDDGEDGELAADAPGSSRHGGQDARPQRPRHPRPPTAGPRHLHTHR
jgi:hypothetical protein